MAAPGRRPQSLAQLPRTGPPVGRILPADGLYAPRTDAGQRAPVLGQLGLSDGRLLRRHQPLWLAPGLHVLCRPLPPERHRRDPGLGAGPLPARRARLADVRRHAPVRTRRPAPGRASRLGHADLQLRTQRGPQFPRLERAVLARQIPHRRPARRRRGLDDLPRLQPQSRRVDAQRIRRPGKPAADLAAQGIQRANPPAISGRADDRRRIDRLAPASRGRPTSAGWASASSGTWAG